MPQSKIVDADRKTVVNQDTVHAGKEMYSPFDVIRALS